MITLTEICSLSLNDALVLEVKALLRSIIWLPVRLPMWAESTVKKILGVSALILA